MSDTPYVVQKIEWFQFRDPDGHAFFVMVSTLPNGFYTAVPCDLQMARLDIVARRPGDPASLVADPSALRTALGWTPVHSTLDEIVDSAVQWEERRRQQ